MEKDTDISETHLESVSAEEIIPMENEWLQHLVKPIDPLEEILWNNDEEHIPVEETQNKALGDVFSSDVDNYEGQVEKSAQNALKVPQIESIDTSKVWTYAGREYNGETMTAKECVDRGLKWWCLQDGDTGEFCTSDYLVLEAS